MAVAAGAADGGPCRRWGGGLVDNTAGRGGPADNRAERSSAAALARPGPGRCGAARARLRRRRRLRRPRQLRHELHRGRELRLRAGVDRRDRQPDGHAGAVPVRQDRRRHRARPAAALPRALRRARVRGPVGAGRAHRHGNGSGRVRRGGDRPEPAVPRAAAGGGTDHGGRRVRHPGPGAARLPAVRAGHRRPARHRVPRLRL